jgi:hypothetical protein
MAEDWRNACGRGLTTLRPLASRSGSGGAPGGDRNGGNDEGEWT